MKNPILLVLFIPLFYSCKENIVKEEYQKSEISDNISIEQFLQYKSSENGIIILQEAHASGNTGPDNGILISGTLLDADMVPIEGVELFIDGKEIPKIGESFMADSFLANEFQGKNVTVELKDLQGVALLEGVQMYIPEPIATMSPNIISPGEQITWDVDPNDPKRITSITIEYEPLLPVNLRFAEDEFVSNVEYISTSDGFYMLDQGLFNGIPDKSYVTLIVSRINYIIIPFPIRGTTVFYPLRSESQDRAVKQVQY